MDVDRESDFGNNGIKDEYLVDLGKNHSNDDLNNQYREYNNLNKLSNLEIYTPKKIKEISSDEVLPSNFNRKSVTSKLRNYS